MAQKMIEATSTRCIQRYEDQSSRENSSDDIIRITFSDIKQALKDIKPSIAEKEVRWNDISGMQSVKQELKSILEEPIKNPEKLKRLGLPLSRGTLLFGPSGCCKTMIAKALSSESGLNVVYENVSGIQNKYVGKRDFYFAVGKLFELAKKKDPCILFLDEIDALDDDRERILMSFLGDINCSNEIKNVTIIAATNRPDKLAPCFFRLSKIINFIYVPLPDLEAREEILKLQMENKTVAADFDYKYLALKTEGYSGAEIVNICKEAAFQILQEDIDCESAIYTVNHFLSAMETIKPSTPAELLEIYEEFNEKLFTTKKY